MNGTLDRDPNDHAAGLTPELAYRQGRILVAALALGVLLFYGMALYMNGMSDAEPANPMFGADAALMIWGLLAVAGLSAALVFRNKAASQVEEARRSARAPDSAELGRVQSFVIIAAALMEGPALFAGVMALTSGHTQLLPWAAAMFALGLAIVFPRAEWYGVGGRRG